MEESQQQTPEQQQQEQQEVKWTDACIRWTEDEVEPHMRPSSSSSHHHHNSNNDDDDDQEFFSGNDPFADPEPLKEYTLEYTVRMDDDDDDDNTIDNNNTTKISLNIQGYLEDTDEAWESTGLTLWKATHTLNHYLVQNYHRHMMNNTTTSLNILELGAGLGVCGILLSKLMRLSSPSSLRLPKEEASSSPTRRMKQRICITDGDTQTLKVLRQNVQRNNDPVPSHHNDHHHHDDEEYDDEVVVSVQQLLWGRATAQAFLKAQPHREQQRFDYIVASDIIYAPQVLVPLWETVDTLLAASDDDDANNDAASNDAKFILAFCQRQVPVQVQDVLDMATKFHFQATRIQVNCDDDDDSSPTLLDDDDIMTASKEHAVYLYEFQRQTPQPATATATAQKETTTKVQSS